MLVMICQLFTFLVLFALVMSSPVTPRNRVLVVWLFCALTLAFVLGGAPALWRLCVAMVVLLATYKATPFFIKRVKAL